MTHTMEDIAKKLAEKDYKLTPQRKTIVEVFRANPDRHLSAEDVYGIVKATDPEIGMATIYRTLDLLYELDVLQRMDFGDGRSRYELAQNEVHHHHHLICTRCGRVLEFEDDLLESLEEAIARKSNFKITDHHLKFYGYCEKCR
ncbi:ferric uptake regulator, Fur family [Thermincola ferriacetica]|uniref:Ferric uptake regulator, Fur family n=2 Tax=Thermincola TaxID=278993 RepID=D5XEW5_THEPJ|nr:MULTISPECIES: Fur family transcriptional regulator [Thermincola]ADG82186.1 ferric uptake regulator, Fur family [Thermincola potens JR]KNZ71204.1 ferric uptake regulator, Fur family [Thermincola ferriacetica]